MKSARIKIKFGNQVLIGYVELWGVQERRRRVARLEQQRRLITKRLRKQRILR